MPLTTAALPEAIKAVQNLIHDLKSYLDRQPPDPGWFGPGKPDPDPFYRWMSKISQAGEAVQRVLLPSRVLPDGSVEEVRPWEENPYSDITGSDFSIPQRAVLKGLVKYCGRPDLALKCESEPEQAIVYLEEVLTKLGNSKTAACILHQGGLSYSLQGHPPVVVTKEEANVLCAFAETKAAMDTEALANVVANPSRVMKQLADKFPGTVRRPRPNKKGEGYYIDVRSAG